MTNSTGGFNEVTFADDLLVGKYILNFLMIVIMIANWTEMERLSNLLLIFHAVNKLGRTYGD
jgi:hypothetical protein